MVCGTAVTVLIADCLEVKLDDPGQENMTLRWQNRIISNFEYLEYLNRSVLLVFCLCCSCCVVMEIEMAVRNEKCHITSLLSLTAWLSGHWSLMLH